jgi:hypothetical protein
MLLVTSISKLSCFRSNGKELIKHIVWIVPSFQILQALIVCTKHILGLFFVFCSMSVLDRS